MSQKLHLLLAEDGLLRVDGNTVLTQAAKHLAKMMLMRSMVRAHNQNVIEVDEDEGQTSEHLVHQMLAGRPRIP